MWLSEILDLIQKDGNLEKVQSKSLFERSPTIEFDVQQEEIKKHTSPVILHTHLPFRLIPNQVLEKGIKIVYILRNPKDVVVSLYYFYLSYDCLGNFKGTFNGEVQSTSCDLYLYPYW